MSNISSAGNLSVSSNLIVGGTTTLSQPLTSSSSISCSQLNAGIINLNTTALMTQSIDTPTLDCSTFSPSTQVSSSNPINMFTSTPNLTVNIGASDTTTNFNGTVNLPSAGTLSINKLITNEISAPSGGSNPLITIDSALTTSSAVTVNNTLFCGDIVSTNSENIKIYNSNSKTNYVKIGVDSTGYSYVGSTTNIVNIYGATNSTSLASFQQTNSTINSNVSLNGNKLTAGTLECTNGNVEIDNVASFSNTNSIIEFKKPVKLTGGISTMSGSYPLNFTTTPSANCLGNFQVVTPITVSWSPPSGYWNRSTYKFSGTGIYLCELVLELKTMTGTNPYYIVELGFTSVLNSWQRPNFDTMAPSFEFMTIQNGSPSAILRFSYLYNSANWAGYNAYIQVYSTLIDVTNGDPTIYQSYVRIA